jgi:hypothetical protein
VLEIGGSGSASIAALLGGGTATSVFVLPIYVGEFATELTSATGASSLVGEPHELDLTALRIATTVVLPVTFGSEATSATFAAELGAEVRVVALTSWLTVGRVR